MDQVPYSLAGAVATYSAKSALFSAGYADQGAFFDSTGSFTITLTTAGMSAGWSAWFRTVSGTQTFDPSGGTLINGATTYAVSNPGDVVLVEYTGSAFVISQSQLPASVAIAGGTIIGTTISGAIFIGGTLSGSTLLGATISGSTLIVPTLSGATSIGGTISGATIIAPAISGGSIVGTSINSATIGATTPAAGTFTTVTVSGAVSAGANSTLSASNNALLSLAVSNTSTGTSANTRVSCANDGGINVIVQVAGSAVTATVFGIAAGGYAQLRQTSTGAGANGMLIGCAAAVPVVFGTNNLERARIDGSGNVVVGSAALAINATDGYFYIPTVTGAPSGTPTAYTGRSPLVVDATNNKLYFYSSSAWRDAGP